MTGFKTGQVWANTISKIVLWFSEFTENPTKILSPGSNYLFAIHLSFGTVIKLNPFSLRCSKSLTLCVISGVLYRRAVAAIQASPQGIGCPLMAEILAQYQQVLSSHDKMT
ncbi:hypothetical protein BGP_0143 [Beggiatoa sp. PS]|nr:hypothetical protein BGP_0143 [Beggiatoa sp. PS]